MLQTTESITKKYYKEKYKITFYPKSLYELREVLEGIQKQDGEQLKILAYNCNLIDKELFKTILKSQNIGAKETCNLDDKSKINKSLQNDLKSTEV